MKLESNFNYSLLARLTPGYVGADLMSLCREAAMFSVDRIFTDLHHKNKMRVQEMDGEGMDIEGELRSLGPLILPCKKDLGYLII